MTTSDPTGPTLDDEGVPDLEGPLPAKAATGDPQEGASPPTDRPASLDWGTTAAEQARPEPLDVRLRRELPDEPILEEAREHLTGVRMEDEDIGGFDDEKDLVAREIDVGDDVALSPEEAAMHIEDESDHRI
jgi:hypothetical protein